MKTSYGGGDLKFLKKLSCDTCFFYKHMKFRNPARLCLAVSDFEAHIMLNFSRYRTNVMGKI